MMLTVNRLLLFFFAVLLLFTQSAAMEIKLVAHDGEAKQYFGASVAIDNTLLVAAPGNFNDDNCGAVYAFEKRDWEWVEIQRLVAADDGPYDLFGYSMAKSGSHAIVSARGDRTNPLGGAVYFFEQQQDGQWVRQARFSSPQICCQDLFGAAVDMDGGYAVVGAPLGGGHLPKCGSAYIYRHVDGEWLLDDKIYPQEGTPYDNFGCSASISGQRVIIGAAGSSSKPCASPQDVNMPGSAWIFERDESGWHQVARLSPVDGHAGNLFGCAVCIDGDRAIIGASQDNAADFHSGSAYIYARADDGWNDELKLVAMDADSGDYFGSAVAIYQDYIIIGAPGVDGLGKNSGAVYSYMRRDDGWTPRAKKTQYDAARYDLFGASLALSQQDALIGAPFKKVGKSLFQGVTYVYDNIQDLALPVELASFTARHDEHAVLLQWMTQSEKDNLGFILERKTNGPWRVIASYQTFDALRGQGSCSMPTYYEFIDDSVLVNTTYYYRLADVDMSGLVSYHEPIEIRMAAGIEHVALLPNALRVMPAFPNPFNPETVLRYELHSTSCVDIKVFDLRGRPVRTLLSGQQNPGHHSVTWNGRDDAGERQSSGVYVIRIRAENVVSSQKVIMMQ